MVRLRFSRDVIQIGAVNGEGIESGGDHVLGRTG